MKDDLRYTPSDCFETFPFPNGYRTNAALERVGKSYYEFRANLLIRWNVGLTAAYGRFHDPNDDTDEILRLRELHDAMDRAVLDAYGWQDLQPVCEFFPEFDEEDEEDEGGRPKRKKYRYRWPEEIHDEVLARLLDLNRQRALEEGQLLAPELTYPAASGEAKRPRSRERKQDDPTASQPGLLFGQEQET